MGKNKLIKTVELINIIFNICSVFTAISLGLIIVISACFLPSAANDSIKSTGIFNLLIYLNAGLFKRIILVLIAVFIFSFGIRTFIKLKFKDYII